MSQRLRNNCERSPEGDLLL